MWRRVLLAKAMGLAWVCGGLGLGGCQDYNFQEVTSSVIQTDTIEDTEYVYRYVDILFVIDNSRSMAGEQKALALSFQNFTGVLNEKFGEGRYRIAVVTTGMQSPECGPCPPDDPARYSCMNETGESGRFQDRLGRNVGSDDVPEFEFVTDPNCRIITSDNVDCFYDAASEQGVVLVGVNGCGYERGLAPIRAALSPPLIDENAGWNRGFLRDEAVLAVVVVTDEEDCGEVGDVTEMMEGIRDKACYYAAKGVAPDGSLSDPFEGRPYELTPVHDYYDFLLGLKGDDLEQARRMVKFAAVVGMDAAGADATSIEYESAAAGADKLPACTTPGCSGRYCEAFPGTRYLELAELFGENGFYGTICQQDGDFSNIMEEIATFIACQDEFKLTEPILDPGLANILVNGEPVPRYFCSESSQTEIEVCAGLADDSCSAGVCIETWSYHPPSDPPDPDAPGGRITFAERYDPCKLIAEGEIHIEVVYAVR